jgi:hypothetical protein
MSAKDTVNEVLAVLDGPIAEREAKLRALDATIHAREENLRELDERIGDKMVELSLKEEIDKLKAQCREFANS